MQSKQKHNETNDDEIDSAACSIFQRRACVCVCLSLCACAFVTCAEHKIVNCTLPKFQTNRKL